LKTR